MLAYVFVAPTTIVDGDNAEFATLGEVGGRAHPTGYPLYVLYLRALSWLPGASPAHTAGLATALLAALLVLVLHAACRAWGARPLPATIACAIYAASPVVLRMHAEAEVFALNGLVVASVVWLAAEQGPARGVRRAALLGLAAGLGVANHMTCTLATPIGIYGIVRAFGETPRRALVIPAAVGALVVGLLPYAYLFVADGPASFGTVDTLDDLRAFVTREVYGGPGAFAPNNDPALVTDSLVALAATLGRAWLGVFALLGLGLYAIAVVRPPSDTRWGWITLAGSFVLAGPLLASRFNVPPVELGLYIVQRFHLLPLLLLAIPVAVGLDRAWTRFGDRVRLDRLQRPAVANGVVLVGFVALVGVALPRLSALHSPALDRAMRNMLRELPPNAIAIVSGDDLCLGTAYVQHALGERPDVTVVCWGFADYPWYRAELRAKGVRIVDGSASQVAEANFATGRPIFMNSQRQMLGGGQRLPSYPHGGLVRVLPRGSQVPSVDEILDLNRRLFARYELDYAPPGPDDDWATVTHMRFATTWVLIANALRAAGRTEDADGAMGIAYRLYPAGFEP